MFNSTVLEAAIGLALVYLVISLFCTAVNEALAGILQSRARNLERGIRSLFSQGKLSDAIPDKDGKLLPAVNLVDALYAHGLIQGLYRSTDQGATILKAANAKDLKTPPSYIPSRAFASALYDILFPTVDAAAAAANPEEANAVRLQAMLKAFEAMPDGAARQAMLTLVKEAQGNAIATRRLFEKWYDDGMDRAAGWYKRNTQVSLFLIGAGLAVLLNVDSVRVGQALWTTPALHAYAMSAAQEYVKHNGRPSDAMPGVAANNGAGQANATPSGTAAASPTAADPAGQSAGSAPGAASGSSAPAASQAGASSVNGSAAANAQGQNPIAIVAGADSDFAHYLQLLKSLNLPIGWKANQPWWHATGGTFWEGLVLALFGWFLTGIATTLGAPFWFDTLNQFMVVRSTIKPREKSEVEPSKN